MEWRYFPALAQIVIIIIISEYGTLQTPSYTAPSSMYE